MVTRLEGASRESGIFAFTQLLAEELDLLRIATEAGSDGNGQNRGRTP
jgi:hypothetical protein